MRDPASWRDPSGFVYRSNGVLYRQIQPGFAEEWQAFIGSGLHSRLVERGMLIPHQEAPLDVAHDASAWRIVQPEPIDFVSYPFEWTFGQLKDAARLTLDVQLEALDAGFTLRDASAYNVQFRGVEPVLIDSLSFARHEQDTPWIAYGQFCEQFLAPLVLMAYRDIRLAALLRASPDGIPLDLAAGLLPGRTRLRLGLGSHVHLHARAQRQHARDGAAPVSGERARPATARITRDRLRLLIRSLRGTVDGLGWTPAGTEWADYADNTSYDDEATRSKERIVEGMLAEGGGHVVWDLGANTGRYSAIAARLGRRVLALDNDPAAAERHFRTLRRDHRAETTPLVVDLANPGAGLGWAGRERRSLAERSNADALLALALVHHLAIGRNVPLSMVADWLAELGGELVIEWVPKQDPMVQRLLVTREDIFPDYKEDSFLQAFAPRWQVASRSAIEHSDRLLFRMTRRS